MDGFRGTTTSDRIVPLQILADMNISPLTVNALQQGAVVIIEDRAVRVWSLPIQE